MFSTYHSNIDYIQYVCVKGITILIVKQTFVPLQSPSVTNRTRSSTAAVEQICEADSGVLILAFCVPKGFSREEIKHKELSLCPRYLYHSHHNPGVGDSKNAFPLLFNTVI